MAEIVQTITGGGFPSPRRQRRWDDGPNSDPFRQWLSKDGAANEKDEWPSSPLLQRPMTNMDGLLMIARMREQLDEARGLRGKANPYAESRPQQGIQNQNAANTEDQYSFAFSGQTTRPFGHTV